MATSELEWQMTGTDSYYELIPHFHLILWMPKATFIVQPAGIVLNYLLGIIYRTNLLGFRQETKWNGFTYLQ